MNKARHEDLAGAISSWARNAGMQATLNPKLELVKIDPADVSLSQHCVDITVSASTSDTYSTL